MATTDLGCATVENEILYDRPGTILYLAPEQREKPKIGENVDIWALGFGGLELFGRLPYLTRISNVVEVPSVASIDHPFPQT